MMADARASAPAWVRLPVAAHRAAIMGKLVDLVTGAAVEGARVELSAMPAPFQQWLATRALAYGAAQWAALPERPDRTVTAADGCFRFIDLPEGPYSLAFSPPGGARYYGRAVKELTLAAASAGQSEPLSVRIKLPPTGLRGHVQTEVQGAAVPLSMACVRVRDSGERAYCDQDGCFYLTGVETGRRALVITAVGYEPLIRNVDITEGRVKKARPFVLKLATP